jgi:hypothetical protein
MASEMTFTYQTRLELNTSQDTILQEYANCLNHVERSLYTEVVKGKTSAGLKRKFPRLNDRKEGNISLNITLFSIIQPRTFGSVQMLVSVRKVSLEEDQKHGRTRSVLEGKSFSTLSFISIKMALTLMKNGNRHGRQNATANFLYWDQKMKRPAIKLALQH